MEEEGERGGGGGPDEGNLLVRIHVPELNVQKCLQFPRDQLVWDVKQQCLAALPKELKESFNYGLFSPPENGRAGKFLDEERRLGDYPFSGTVGYLELKYKRRVYKMVSLDEKQLKSLHTRANLRRFLDYVSNGQVEKITKMCSKGLDPNFHCQDSGETPLTIATGIKKPSKVLIALVNGGALLDYRTKDGSTAVHRSVEHRSLEALKTLLELGASPNYKDGKGLSPLYLTISQHVDPEFAETLLHDHATTGTQDLQGWAEVHQACKTGLYRHLEHLLFYGADMNSQNASGNTPLHVCAVNNQEKCAGHLLFRGADRKALNFANQTPYQVAVIAGNMELADIIQNYRQEDVVRYRGPPKYNPKRRSAIGFLQRAPSISTLALPPSPCPSDRSSAPFSSASSSLSDGSTNAPPGHETDTASIVTVLALGVADKSLGDTSDIISDSSGVGTANSDATNCSISMPGTTVVCIVSYSPTPEDDGHISLREGDIVEVTGASDDGLLEGIPRAGGQKSGLFPFYCVQEFRFRSQNIQAPIIVHPQTTIPCNPRVLGRRESTTKHFATAPRLKKTFTTHEPRTVQLHRGKKGFGFILRGAKATSPLMDLTPSEKCPALQYLDDVDPGGVADRAGLQKNDFLLEINGEDVTSASHEHVVDLIRKSGNFVQMTVLSQGPQLHHRQAVLPTSKSIGLLEAGGAMAVSRNCATLPRKMGANVGRSAHAPLPPRRDPKTTLSVGRARAKSMVVGLEEPETGDMAKSSSAESIHKNGASRTASIRARPTSHRITSAELEQLFNNGESMQTSRFQTGGGVAVAPGSPAKSRVYASVSEMKRSKSKNSKVRFTSLFRHGSGGGGGGGELRRDFHSTPDLAQEIAISGDLSKRNRSQEDLTTVVSRALPPPTYPPPPPPPSVQVVKVGKTRPGGEYDHLGKEVLDKGVVSSFRPTANARLYASPEDMKTVGYRSKSLPSHASRPVRKSHSMRTNNSFKPTNTSTPPPPPSSTTLPSQSNNKNTNPYAQPIRASRSHSTASNSVNSNNRRRKISSSKSASNVVILTQGGPTPSIPEPDYSCSESDRESEEEKKDISGLAARLASHQLQPVENSGNSNASGSSSGSSSSSVPHSISVEDIKKGRSQLKSSKSYPDDFLKKQSSLDAEQVLEDGDNSSSGVSSDQENAAGNNHHDYHHEHSNNNSMTLPSPKSSQRHHHHQIGAGGLMSRHAVSLAQLPPPLEAENDEKEEFCSLPPPPEFVESNGGGEGEVLAPPPQFCDNRQVSRVRIVGTVPKTSSKTTKSSHKSGRLHSQ